VRGISLTSISIFIPLIAVRVGLAATPGELDTSFGSEGKVITEVGATDEKAQAVLVDAKGRILLVGDVKQASVTNHPHDVGVVRYNPDGSLDTAFGSGGKVITNFSPATNTNGDDHALDAILDAEGRILVVGSATDASTPFLLSDFLIARYREDGTLDPTFGPSGKGFVTIIVTAGADQAQEGLAAE